MCTHSSELLYWHFGNYMIVPCQWRSREGISVRLTRNKLQHKTNKRSQRTKVILRALRSTHTRNINLNASGVGVTKPISPVPWFFLNFSLLSKHILTVKYRIYIWQVSPQLSCGDTCQIWMWFDESNMYFCETENFAYGEINERSFSNPHPWWFRGNLVNTMAADIGSHCIDYASRVYGSLLSVMMNLNYIWHISVQIWQKI